MQTYTNTQMCVLIVTPWDFALVFGGFCFLVLEMTQTQTARKTTTHVVPCPVLRAQMDPILIAVLNLTPGKFLLKEEGLGGLPTLIISRYNKVGPFMGQCQCL